MHLSTPIHGLSTNTRSLTQPIESQRRAGCFRDGLRAGRVASGARRGR
jgi:hypothetical protein